MDWNQNHADSFSTAILRGVLVLRLAALGLCSVPLGPTLGSAQRPTAALPTLVFDHVTIVDVEHGKLLPDRRVVIVGTRILAIGVGGAGRVPTDAQMVEARGKYLIPGLWDMHVHPGRKAESAYQLLVANGITGIRDAGSPVPLDTLRLWRREILAGTRIGPPRQLLSGQSITGPVAKCDRNSPQRRTDFQTCVADSADAVRYVDSLKAAGADMIKPREVSAALYAVIAAESRRIGIPFGGHVGNVPELEASDRGATIADHAWGDANCAYEETRLESSLNVSGSAGQDGGVMQALRELGVAMTKDKGFQPGDPRLTSCWKQAAERFRRNKTWFVPTLVRDKSPYVLSNFHFGLLLLAGTDMPVLGHGWGVSLHKQLALYVAYGLTPLEALQTATLNPAKMLRATDSLGTVAAGKLADLVLLDADPLANITNTTLIRAVVANGRYFDRAALDQLLSEVPAKKQR